jgi:hypothetical protein
MADQAVVQVAVELAELADQAQPTKEITAVMLPAVQAQAVAVVVVAEQAQLVDLVLEHIQKVAMAGKAHFMLSVEFLLGMVAAAADHLGNQLVGLVELVVVETELREPQAHTSVTQLLQIQVVVAVLVQQHILVRQEPAVLLLSTILSKP